MPQFAIGTLGGGVDLAYIPPKEEILVTWWTLDEYSTEKKTITYQKYETIRLLFFSVQNITKS